MEGGKMYEEYRISELVNETLTKVIDKAQHNHERLSSIKKLQSIEEVHEYEQLSKDLEEEYRKSVQVIEDTFEPARTHWIQLQKSNKQGLAIRSCFLLMLEKYPHVRPIWGFGKTIDDGKDDAWKPELVEDFYFRHHCASLQAAMNMIIKNKDDRNGLRRMLNEMGGHHFFYDACEPHFEIFRECFLAGMKMVLNGGDALDEEIEQSWIMLLETIRTHMSEGIEIQRLNYLSQTIIPAEMDEVKEHWKRVREFGLEKAGIILCDVACKKYKELIRSHNLRMKLPSGAEKGSTSYKLLASQIVQAFDQTIESYRVEDGFCGLVENIRDFVVTFLVVDVSPPLMRRAIIEGLVFMLSQVLRISHVKEDFVHIWNKIYRVMEQAMIANIIDY
ncbi:unnamed protein product [Caenorhabditis angaria]|uniref:Globin domain-containing protein n=1 Tax=Caenorhabditis angaria TaxID=860376 RepID=A0A9P1IXG4_9PELO|nr:unnamed protein product [Caenorhabditis angaria]